MRLNKLFILGACSVPFLASCGCSNNDQKALDDVNTILRNEADTIHTCHDAIVAAEAKGIELNDYQFANKNHEFAYDAKAKQFVIMEGDKIVKTSPGYQASESTFDYFKSVFTYNPNSKYSQYLDKRAEVPEQLLITTGFDIGAHIDIPFITYTNLSNHAREVIIRTYSDYFTVLAPLDTIHHYQIATNVIVTDVVALDMHSETAYIKATKGNINFAKDSETTFFEVKEGSEKDVKITSEEGAIFSAAINIPAEDLPKGAYLLNSTSAKVYTDITDALENNPLPFIRLTQDVIFPVDSGINLSSLGYQKSACIDLAGYKLTFTGSSEKVAINVEDGFSLYLLDSQGVLDNNSGIILNDCYININNNGNGNESTLMVNGGKITQIVSTTDPTDFTAAVTCAGNISTDPTKKAFNSNFLMYGGKIETKMKTLDAVPSVCVTSYGLGANANITYGTLISDSCCVACNPGLTPGYSLDGSSLTINGGYFTSGLKYKSSCIEYGKGVNITINGGTFVGDSCIAIQKGTLTINGGVFNSTAQYRPYHFGADGSVINVYQGNADTKDLLIDIKDATLYSTFAYVLSLQDGAKAQATFHSGLYSYYLDNGIKIGDDAKLDLTIENPDNFIQHGI